MGEYLYDYDDRHFYFQFDAFFFSFSLDVRGHCFFPRQWTEGIVHYDYDVMERACIVGPGIFSSSNHGRTSHSFYGDYDQNHRGTGLTYWASELWH